MKNGVLGTGMVGQTIGKKLAELGHDVRMGARQAGNDTAAAWARCWACRRTGPTRRSSRWAPITRSSSGTWARTRPSSWTAG